MISNQSIYEHDPRCEAVHLGGELVVLDGAGQTLRGFNRVAARVWELLDGLRPVEAIASEIAREFRQDERRVLADVAAFISALADRSLVRLAATDDAGGGR